MNINLKPTIENNSIKNKIMKKTSLIVLLCLISLNTVKAQEIEGIVHYVSRTKIDFKIDSTQVSKELYNQMKSLIKKQSVEQFILEFNINESIFKKAEELYVVNPNSTIQVGNGTTMSAGQGEITFGTGKSSLIYKNLKENRYVKKADILGKEFLISDVLEKRDWILENETKNIGEFTCYKAIYKHINKGKEITVTAWYTPEIPVKNGPDNFGGLPGLIMQVSADDESFNFVTNKVILNPKKGVNTLKPKKGKKVSQAEFDLIFKNKMEELRSRSTNGSTIITSDGNN